MARHRLHGARHRQRGEIGDGHAIDLHRQALRPQPLALAARALGGRHVVQQPLAVAVGSGLFQRLPQEGENAVPSGRLALALLAAP